MQNTRIPTLRPLALVALCGAAFGASAASANAAGTASFDGSTVSVVGTPTADEIFVSREQDGTIFIVGIDAGPGCEYTLGDRPGSPVRCPDPAAIRISSLGGDDEVGFTDWLEPRMTAAQVLIELGDGNDRYSAREVDGAATVRGGAGNDDIEGSRGNDDLDGGPGNDKVRGFHGDDVVRGGDGNDELAGDASDRRGADLIDGGAGRDVVDDWWNSEDKAALSLDGIANDGFADEGDNLIGVEQVISGAALAFDGDDGENYVTAGEVATYGGSFAGRGGDDTFIGTDRADRIDGGPGADELIGGYGNDTIVGGPGQDTIVGDRTARCNEMHCDLSPGSAADTIDAVDGEVDTISCGPGNDAVRADVIDRVDIDCEQVVRVAAAALAPGASTSGNGARPGGSASGAGAGGPAGAPGLQITTTTLKTALRRGIKVRMTGLAAGRKLKLTATVAGRTVGTGSAKVSKAGTATVTIRITKAGRRVLAGRRTANLTVRGGGHTAKAMLRR